MFSYERSCSGGAISWLGETVGTGVFDGLGIGLIGVGVGVEITDVAGVGFKFITPLSHTNFLPDLIQVYFLPENVLVKPNFLQEVPGLIAALAWIVDKIRKAVTTTIEICFFIRKGYFAPIGFVCKISEAGVVLSSNSSCRQVARQRA